MTLPERTQKQTSSKGVERPLPQGTFWQGDWTLRLVSLLSLLALWVVFSQILSDALLPGPLETLQFLGKELSRGALTFHLWATFKRVLVAFGLAMLLGTALGIAMGASRRADRLLEAYLIVGLTIPRIVLFVMAYLILGLSDWAAIVALILAVLPTIIAQLREGTQALDSKLIDMAKAFRRPRRDILRHVVLPQLLPYLVGTARGALSLAWKMVVLAELLGRTSGVGYQITFYFQMFNMKGILAYGLAMMVILALVDFGFTALSGRAFRWRSRALGGTL